MKAIFAGGGTAGHINPAISAAQELCRRDPDAEVLFIGVKGHMEETLCQKAGFPISFIRVAGFDRRHLLKNIKIAGEALTAVRDAKKIIRDFAPDVVVGTGGYVSGPVVYAASRLKIPTVIHEQNVLAGVTTKLLCRVAKAVGTAFDECKLPKCRKKVCVGNPLRAELFGITREEAREKLGIPQDAPFVVGIGGSLGARAINENMLALMHAAPEKMHIWLSAGKGGYEKVYPQAPKKTGCQVLPYIYNAGEVYAAADLLVCRAGAITLSELNAMGKPAVLIPSPYVAENHQEHNARLQQERGAAKMLTEAELNEQLFLDTVFGLVNDPQKLQEMSEASLALGVRDATARFADLILRMAK